jgi:hypothetical protein
MKSRPLPATSRRYSQRAFAAKARWHRRQAQMSFTRKVQALDRLLQAAKRLPRLERRDR